MSKVLFVCLGNICRSPLAHGVFETMVQQAGLADAITIDSCGTGAWHVGEAPDSRMQDIARARGYELSHLRARKLSRDDFNTFDHILAMDARNLADIMKLAPEGYAGNLKLFLDYHPDPNALEVPDPYYGGKEGFELVFQLVETASSQLLDELRKPS